MKRRMGPFGAVLSVLLMTVLVASVTAQINGVPASVTSPGFGGRAINGTPPSVTSLGPRGFTSNVPAGRAQFFATTPPVDSGRRHHHHGNQNIFPTYGVVYPMPVAVPYPVATEENGPSEAEREDDAQYQGGPTVFDRRGRGEQSYIAPEREAPPAHTEERTEAAPVESDQGQEPTLLVFKDGHELEIGNYAVVGQTLFDLTPGHPRRVAVAQLNLEATQQKNEERGVTFQLPISALAN